ncbi:MAG TPA: sulfite exporter TauE/SafE family protein, partial [Candidatus Saccharimonadales bacterium]|nr:sulfite exporter TauE/SafE family protein [Candidatus Saccharimonadales bacterium]
MEWLVVLTFFVSFLASVISGMGGGGGGFIMIPYYLFIGLPPANALATGKLGGIGVAVGAVTAFRGRGLVRKRLLWPLVTITFICSLISAWLIPKINAMLFENIIGIALIALVPTLFIGRAELQPGPRTRPWIIAGFILYTIFSFLQTLIGTGIGSLLGIILMFLFGLSALESTATKRVAQSVQAFMLFILLALQGLVWWAYGIAALAGAGVGSYIGSR